MSELPDIEYVETIEEVTPELPVDTDGLSKGDTIPHNIIEQALGIRKDNPRYRLAVLGLARFIDRRFKDRNEPVTIRVFDSTGIRILTDEEALEYNTHRFELETKQRNRAYVRLTQTDRGLLSDNSKSFLDRKVVELGHRVQIDRKARREPQIPAPTTRQTPDRIR